MNWKIISKKYQIKKQIINVKMPHVNKKTTSEKWKFSSNNKQGLEWTMNGLGKPFRKNPIQRIENNTVKITAKLPHVNKKHLARKRNFVQTPFSHSTFKIERKNFTPQNQSLHFLFRRDQDHYSNLTSKIMKTCEQILKKRQRPNTIQFLWIVKRRAPK